MRSLLAAALIALSLVVPGTALAAVKAGQPFPSNLFTTSDRTQVTGLRVDLPKPDCAVRPSDCADIVGINQVVWEPAANTLHVESDEQLQQHSRYLLVVTRGVHGSDGQRLDGSAFWRELLARGPAADKAYRTQLLFALGASFFAGADPAQVAAASLFTTQSVDAISKKVRRQIRKGQAPTPIFALGTGGERTVFPLSSITAIQWVRQTGTSTFATSFLPTPALSVFPGSVGTVAFGSYTSPDYQTAAKVIPAVGTRAGKPNPESTNPIQFTLFMPAGAKPR